MTEVTQKPLTVQEEKDVAYYGANVSAWFETRLERDKSLLTISAGGIGVLVTFLSSNGIRSLEGLFLYVLALTAFLICIVLVLYIFQANATHLEQINCNVPQTNQGLLQKLDIAATISFSLALLFSSLIGITLAIHSLDKQEKDMIKEIKYTTMAVSTDKGFQGIARMNPAAVQNSYQGATAMRPQQASDGKNPDATVASGSPKTESSSSGGSATTSSAENNKE